MNLKDIKIDVESTLGDNILLLEIIPKFKYIEGKRTEEIVGYNNILLLPGKQYEKVSISTPIKVVENLNKPTPIRLIGSKGSFYWKDNYPVPYFYAESFEVLK